MFYFQRPLVALNNYGGLTTSRAIYVTVTNKCRSQHIPDNKHLDKLPCMDIGTVFTIIGSLAGVAALGMSIIAKHDSKNSNEIAKRSEQLSAEANSISRKSNRIAVDARQLAKEANAISLRAEQRDTEINDVVWNYKWIKPGTCEFTNSGEDEALSVTINLAVDGDHVQSDRCNIPSGGTITLTHPRLTDELTRCRLELDAEYRDFERRRAAATSMFDLTALGPGPLEMPYRADVRIQIKWLTALGQDRDSHFKDLGCSLDY